MPHIVAAVFAFGVMIFCHELGHFLLAKRVGITVHAFALGFGPRIAGIRHRGTLYAINLFPLGGYVRLAGEDLDDADDPGSFRSKTVWQRMAVVAAGPVMNLLLAVVLLTATVLALGVPVGVSNRIGQLMAGWPAERVGLRSGDAIIAIDGVPMENGEVVIDTIHRRPEQQLVLTIERTGTRFDVTVTSRRDPRQNIGLIGFRPEAIRQRMGAGRALAWSLGMTGDTIELIFMTIGSFFREGRRLLDQLAGPVGAVMFLGEAGQVGAEMFVYTAAGLSIMIGIFNLLPIPALDGGRLSFLIVEAFRRRPVDPKREGYIHLVGFALLLLLLVTLTVRDIGRL